MAIPVNDEIRVAFSYMFRIFKEKKNLILNFLSDTLDTFKKWIRMQEHVSYVHITELKENDMKVPDVIFR